MIWSQSQNNANNFSCPTLNSCHMWNLFLSPFSIFWVMNPSLFMFRGECTGESGRRRSQELVIIDLCLSTTLNIRLWEWRMKEKLRKIITFFTVNRFILVSTLNYISRLFPRSSNLLYETIISNILYLDTPFIVKCFMLVCRWQSTLRQKNLSITIYCVLCGIKTLKLSTNGEKNSISSFILA